MSISKFSRRYGIVIWTLISGRLDITEPGVDERLDITEPGVDGRTGITGPGVDDRLDITEPGVDGLPGITKESGVNDLPGMTKEPGVNDLPGITGKPDIPDWKGEHGQDGKPDIREDRGFDCPKGPKGLKSEPEMTSLTRGNGKEGACGKEPLEFAVPETCGAIKIRKPKDSCQPLEVGQQHGQYLGDVITVDELNKRQLGKAIIKYCGNEGCENSEQKADLRKLLQAVIDYLPMKKTRVWQNAEFTIYDKEANFYRIRSGNGQNRFMVKYSYLKSEIIVREVSKDGQCLMS